MVQAHKKETVPKDRNISGRPKLPFGEKKVQIMLSGILQKYYSEARLAAEEAVKQFKEA